MFPSGKENLQRVEWINSQDSMYDTKSQRLPATTEVFKAKFVKVHSPAVVK